jgi:hypothetical protein
LDGGAPLAATPVLWYTQLSSKQPNP